jgi:uncharacterized membrane protein YphA (DoxX/SURF4 family)
MLDFAKSTARFGVARSLIAGLFLTTGLVKCTGAVDHGGLMAVVFGRGAVPAQVVLGIVEVVAAVCLLSTAWRRGLYLALVILVVGCGFFAWRFFAGSAVRCGCLGPVLLGPNEHAAILAAGLLLVSYVLCRDRQPTRS